MRLATLFLVVLSARILVASVDTLRLDDGTMRSTNQARDRWEESIILDPAGPCRVVEVHVYYGAGSGTDVVYLAGDAAEGAIPPTQYCLPYNTMVAETLNVSTPGWYTIDVRRHNITVGGINRVVVQHLVRPGGPLWGMDGGQTDIRSFFFDPITPNPNFYNIPGIFYRANGDYMVRLVVERPALSRPLPGFVDYTISAGLTHNGSPIKSDNVAVADLNADGLDDIVIGSRIFINKGALRFEAIASPISGSATVWADVDNDGDLDCFAVNGFGNDKVWRNNGDLTFTDITAQTGIVNNAPTVTPLWLDYNGDGRLDLFIANGRTEQGGQEVYFQDRLFRQRQDGTFEDVTTPAGIAAAEPAPFMDTWGASLCDFNDDGHVDIFVATYRLAPDRLYRNNGDGTFTDVSGTSGVQGLPTTVPNYFGHGMGSDWADIDNDGDQDLAVGNLGHPDSRAQYSNPSIIWVNNGAPAPQFTGRTASNGGVAFFEMNAGMCFGDFDQDGLQDLWHGQIAYEQRGSGALRRARVYRNSGGTFEDRTWQWGLDHHGPWTAARADLDGDGDLDLVCASGTEHVNLYRNDLSTEGSSIILRLRNTSTVRHTGGSRVSALVGTTRHRRWLPGTISGGRASQMTSDLHIGMGNQGVASDIEVRWPDRRTTNVSTAVEAGHTWRLDRDGGVQLLARHLPAAIAPLHGTMGLPRQATFRWRTAAEAVLLEVAREERFTSNVARFGPISSSEATIDLPYSEGTMYWRLCNADDTTRWTSAMMAVIGAPSFDGWQVTYPRNGDTTVPMHFEALWSAATATTNVLGLPVAYELQIAETSAPDNPVYEALSLTTLRDSIVGLRARTPYILRIRPYLVGLRVRGPWTTIAFTTYGPPSAPDLLAPADGATNVSVRPLLTVRRIPTAEQYVFQVDSLGVFDAPYERVRGDSALTVLPALRPQTTYRWRVRASNRAGEGAWSPIGSFTTGGTVSVRVDELGAVQAQTAVIIDMTGRIVATIPATDVRRVVRGLPPSTYVVHMLAANTASVGVYIVQP
jgi:hypothetical protein